jgi:DNA repair exonuclease SbcCD ATPase subunit
MDAYRRAIGELERKTRQNDAEIALQLKKLGEHLSYRKVEVLTVPAMADLHRRIQELRKRLPESQQQVKRIMQCAGRNEELERKLKGLRAQAAELQKENEAICEEIGRAAFTAYKSVAPQDERYREIFEPLLEQEQEITRLEAEPERPQSPSAKGGNFFRIFRETGRSLYLKGLLGLKKKNMVRVYKEAGRRFCDLELQGELTDAAVERALAPYAENSRKLQSLNRDVEKIQAEQASLWQELKELGAEKSHQKRVREIEQAIGRIEDELEDAFVGLGSQFRAKPLSALAEDPEITRYLRSIAKAERSNAQHRRQIERIQAAIQIDALGRQRQNLEERIERLDREVKTRQQEIQTLRAQIAEADSETQRLLKTRGPEQSLLKIPDS